MSRSPKRNNSDDVAPHRTNDRHITPIQSPDGKKPFLAAMDRGHYDMRGLENGTDIEKIEAVFRKIGKPFPFIPFIAHLYCVHNLCLHVKALFLALPSAQHSRLPCPRPSQLRMITTFWTLP
jgi:hypothetical protein